MLCRDPTGAGERAIEIGGFPGMAANPIVDQRVAGARIEGEGFVLTVPSPWPDPGDIADPAEIEDGERLRQIRGERGVVEGRQRSPLPARRNIGAAEIGNHVRAGKTRQQGAVADLPGSPLGRRCRIVCP